MVTELDPRIVQNEESFDTIVIGGGQAGLAVGYFLAQQGENFIVLDKNSRSGDAWRCRWESLRLFTPSQIDSLPGMPFLQEGGIPLRHASIRTQRGAGGEARCMLGSDPFGRCNLARKLNGLSSWAQSPGRGGSWSFDLLQ